MSMSKEMRGCLAAKLGEGTPILRSPGLFPRSIPCAFFLLLFLNIIFNWRTITLPLLTFFNKIGAPGHSSQCNKTDLVRPLCFKICLYKLHNENAC